MKKEKLLIFDFDGTIVDSKSLYYTAIESELKSMGLTKEQADKAIDKGMSLTKTFKNLGFFSIVTRSLKRKVMKQILKHVNEVHKCKDVNSLSSLNEKKILVSNSFNEFIIPILKHLKIQDKFSEIYGAYDFKDKADFIKEYVKNNKFNKKLVYYIGDRKIDAAVAKKAGVNSIIIAGKCSLNSKEEIMQGKPDFIVSELKEIKEIVN